MLTSIYWASNSSNTPSQILIIVLFAKNEIPQLILTKNDHYRHFIWKQFFFRNGKFDHFFNILNIRYVLYNLILFVHIYFQLWTYLSVVRILFFYRTCEYFWSFLFYYRFNVSLSLCSNLNENIVFNNMRTRYLHWVSKLFNKWASTTIYNGKLVQMEHRNGILLHIILCKHIQCKQ